MVSEKIESKLLSPETLAGRLNFWRTLGDKIVFTNGCFDILHEGHIRLLAMCRQAGDVVIVGLNSDSSVKKLKGKDRPINKEQSRAVLLAATEFVDAVIIFGEQTPEKLIKSIRPDVLIKGGDWKKEEIIGSGFVESYGGKVQTIPFLKGFSTTNIIAKAKK